MAGSSQYSRCALAVYVPRRRFGGELLRCVRDFVALDRGIGGRLSTYLAVSLVHGLGIAQLGTESGSWREMDVTVAVAGAAGAVMRYLVSGWVQRAGPSNFPTGTLAVNLTGVFLLGVLAGAGALDSAMVVATVGLLGGFTTFSTWMIETLRLGPVSIFSLLNLALTLVGGVALAAVGHSLVT